MSIQMYSNGLTSKALITAIIAFRSFLVDKVIEISNLDLMRDLIEVVDYEVPPFWAFNTDMPDIMRDRLVTRRRSRP